MADGFTFITNALAADARVSSFQRSLRAPEETGKSTNLSFPPESSSPPHRGHLTVLRELSQCSRLQPREARNPRPASLARCHSRRFRCLSTLASPGLSGSQARLLTPRRRHFQSHQQRAPRPSPAASAEISREHDR